VRSRSARCRIEPGLAQQSCQHALPMCERSPHLAIDKQALRNPPQDPVTDLVFDPIAHPGACDAVLLLRGEFVAMQPASERSLHLHIREVMVPFEFGDSSNPSAAQGKWGCYPKRSRNFGTNSRQVIRRFV